VSSLLDGLRRVVIPERVADGEEIRLEVDRASDTAIYRASDADPIRVEDLFR
jgi:hypothetical protein